MTACPESWEGHTGSRPGLCSGFFSLSLAKQVASVLGIDFLQQNIDVCQALAEENPHCDVKFQVGRIEDIVSLWKKTNLISPLD